MKVFEGVLLNNYFIGCVLGCLPYTNPGRHLGVGCHLLHILVPAHKGPFDSIQNMPIMPYYDTVCSSMTLCFPPLGFTWMGNPKAALESKAAVTVVMI